MKMSCSSQRNGGMTLFEVLLVVLVLFLLAIVLLPTFPHAKVNDARIRCMNNLKEVGLSFRIWSGDNNDKYPMAISVNNGGAMEAVLRGDPVQVFQVMSNELSTPTILFCRADTYREWPTNFGSALTAKNVSYFVNADATEVNPHDIMCGDDNFEIGRVPINSGLSVVSSNTPIAWSAERHKYRGNICFADGSVQEFSNAELKKWLRSTNFTGARLAIP
jgi:prepilin-type processing-associated H-X9-DG protein